MLNGILNFAPGEHLDLAFLEMGFAMAHKVADTSWKWLNEAA
jgi:hypothetical protein